MIRALRNLVIATLATVLVAASANPVEAGLLSANETGTFGSGTTLGGTSITGAGFSFQAVFDPTMGTSVATGAAVFATTVDITITGAGSLNGTYASAPGVAGVLTAGTAYSALGGNYGLGLFDVADSTYFGGVLGGANPTFATNPAVATTFSSIVEYLGSGTTNIRLTNGETLAIVGTGTITSASVTVGPAAAVPEPATLIYAAQAVLLLGLASRLRRRKACC